MFYKSKHFTNSNNSYVSIAGSAGSASAYRYKRVNQLILINKWQN